MDLGPMKLSLNGSPVFRVAEDDPHNPFGPVTVTRIEDGATIQVASKAEAIRYIGNPANHEMAEAA